MPGQSLKKRVPANLPGVSTRLTNQQGRPNAKHRTALSLEIVPWNRRQKGDLTKVNKSLVKPHRTREQQGKSDTTITLGKWSSFGGGVGYLAAPGKGIQPAVRWVGAFEEKQNQEAASSWKNGDEGVKRMKIEAGGPANGRRLKKQSGVLGGEGWEKIKKIETTGNAPHARPCEDPRDARGNQRIGEPDTRSFVENPLKENGLKKGKEPNQTSKRNHTGAPPGVPRNKKFSGKKNERETRRLPAAPVRHQTVALTEVLTVSTTSQPREETRLCQPQASPL